MREQYGKIPAPLRRLIFKRFAAGLMGLAFVPVVLASGGGMSAFIPCAAIMTFGGIGGLMLLTESLEERYVVLRGSCIRVEKSRTDRDIQAIWFRRKGMTVKVISRGKWVKDLSVGDWLTVYIAQNAPVYDMNQYKVAGLCLAIEREEEQHSERRGAVHDVG